jgi:hypothetical protein
VHHVALRGADTVAVRMGGASLRLWRQGDGVWADAGGWRARADVAPIWRTLDAERSCEPDWHEFSAAQALLPMRDASGAVRAQLLVTGVSAPTEPGAPPTPGFDHGSVDALLVLPD